MLVLLNHFFILIIILMLFMFLASVVIVFLKTLLRDELQYLEEESISTLNRFYSSIGHVKKEIRQK